MGVDFNAPLSTGTDLSPECRPLFMLVYMAELQRGVKIRVLLCIGVVTCSQGTDGWVSNPLTLLIPYFFPVKYSPYTNFAYVDCKREYRDLQLCLPEHLSIVCITLKTCEPIELHQK